MQPIFQDASAALNPRRSSREHLLQALAVRNAATERQAIALLESVGLRPGDISSALPMSWQAVSGSVSPLCARWRRNPA
jgi:ABC-type dipeptide/oligopeptide/nickel transport system ATPase subunit